MSVNKTFVSHSRDDVVVRVPNTYVWVDDRWQPVFRKTRMVYRQTDHFRGLTAHTTSMRNPRWLR